jgi:hypothetical protein
MNILTGFLNLIYSASMCLGFGMALFVFVLTLANYNSMMSGSSGFVLIGFGFALSLGVAILAIGPLVAFDTQPNMPKFPTPAYSVIFLIAWILSIVGGVIQLIANPGCRRPWRVVGFLVTATAASGWVAKTISLMIFILSSGEYPWLQVIFYELLGLVYILVYFSMPHWLFWWMSQRKEKQPLPEQTVVA